MVVPTVDVTRREKPIVWSNAEAQPLDFGSLMSEVKGPEVGNRCTNTITEFGACQPILAACASMWREPMDCEFFQLSPLFSVFEAIWSPNSTLSHYFPRLHVLAQAHKPVVP
jgi:hypothetical protein